MIPGRVHAQAFQRWFTPSDTLHHVRYKVALTGSLITYSAFSVGLYQLWYADYSRTSFHLFNDGGEWENMDKWGHAYNGYFQSHLIYQGTRWTGMSRKKSIWYGMGGALLFQTTIEVMDGFSEEWGFSIPDMTANLIGVGLFGMQEAFWQNQIIKLKLSAYPIDYPEELLVGSRGSTTTLKERARDLFTDAWASELLKDYNAQIGWMSVNVRSLAPEQTWIPPWLNVALGYGADNMFGGYKNEWTIDGEAFFTPLERSHQIYLSLDIDLDRIPTKNAFLKSLLSMLNIIKIPLPSLEYNTVGGLKGHWWR